MIGLVEPAIAATVTAGRWLSPESDLDVRVDEACDLVTGVDDEHVADGELRDDPAAVEVEGADRVGSIDGPSIADFAGLGVEQGEGPGRVIERSSSVAAIAEPSGDRWPGPR